MTINQVWTEKYRPQNIEDVILNDKEKEYFSSLKEVPNNLLLVGSPGIGKSTIAKILAKKFSPNSYMYINASEQGNIDTVRNLIGEFISVMSIDGNQKIVILDECLEENTLVSILKDGSEQKIPIKDVDPDNDLVKTYNFDLSRIEYRPFFKIDKGVQEVYEVEFENGEFIVCTEDHKWYVEDSMTGEITRKKLKDIISNNILEILTV
jgi:DNA replicative helicase MCM subunit Mcm2 (Cdc46/Mcm family)